MQKHNLIIQNKAGYAAYDYSEQHTGKHVGRRKTILERTIKELEAKLGKATNPEERAVLEQAIIYARAQLSGLELDEHLLGH